MSDRPDPSIDFVGSIRWLMDKFDHMAQFVEAEENKKICASKAAGLLGFDERYFHGKPWRYPHFQPGLYTLKEWREWIEGKSDKERRSEWDLMPMRERKKLREGV